MVVKSYLGSSEWHPSHSQTPATAVTDPPDCSPWTLSPAPASSSTHSEWLELMGKELNILDMLLKICKINQMKSQAYDIFPCCWVIHNIIRTSLASFINICGNLNSCVGVVDIVFEVWIINKLQLDVWRIFHLAFSIHGVLWEHQKARMSH